MSDDSTWLGLTNGDGRDACEPTIAELLDTMRWFAWLGMWLAIGEYAAIGALLRQLRDTPSTFSAHVEVRHKFYGLFGPTLDGV